MNDPNPSSAIAKRGDTGPSSMIKSYTSEFAIVLPSHLTKQDQESNRPPGSQFARLAQGALRRDPKLADIARRNPASLMQALLECARLGHEPGTDSFYLVPMGNEIEGIEGYRGVIERMYRAGAVVSVKAEVVKFNDKFEFNPNTMTRPNHIIDWFGDRGDTIGAYAYADMVGGATSKVVVISPDYIAKVRAMSKGSDKPSSPWVKWYDAMILKTALHRLEPFVPTSAEYIREKMRAARDVAAETAPQPQFADPTAPPSPANDPTAPPPLTEDPTRGELRDDDPDLLFADAEIVEDKK